MQQISAAGEKLLQGVTPDPSSLGWVWHARLCLPLRMNHCHNKEPVAIPSMLLTPQGHPPSNPGASMAHISADEDADPPCLLSGPHPQSSPNLPHFDPINVPSFSWGSIDGVTCSDQINACYVKAIKWKHNLFKVPSGKLGTALVKMTRLFRAYAERSSLEAIALKAVFLLPVLLLQKPHDRSKAKDHIFHLNRRLNLWKEGAFDSLLNEGRAIQHQLKSTRQSNSKSSDTLARSFSKFMMKGKVQSAIRLICDKGNGKPLSLDDCVPDGTSHPRTVREILHEKHPDPSPVVPSAILSLDTPSTDHEPHSVILINWTAP